MLLAAGCAGGLSSVVVHGIVDSAVIPGSIAEGQTLEVEVLVVLEAPLDTFSHFSNDVNTGDKEIRIRPYVRENRGDDWVPVNVITHEFARFDDLAPGEWDVHVDGTNKDVDGTVTVNPTS
jgi:hypothetical protein